MLHEILIPAWQCSFCGHICRSKQRPRRCTSPGCYRVDQPKPPGPKPRPKPEGTTPESEAWVRELQKHL